jgi:hypothetical protein
MIPLDWIIFSAQFEKYAIMAARESEWFRYVVKKQTMELPVRIEDCYRCTPPLPWPDLFVHASDGLAGKSSKIGAIMTVVAHSPNAFVFCFERLRPVPREQN